MEKQIFLNDAIKILGWQGGTIHQVLDEIKRLKKLDKNCIGCRYNSVETNVWHPDKCPLCVREDRDDKFMPR